MSGMSIENVAELAGIGVRSLHAYEARKNMPSAVTLSNWAGVFDCRIMIMPME